MYEVDIDSVIRNQATLAILGAAMLVSIELPKSKVQIQIDNSGDVTILLRMILTFLNLECCNAQIVWWFNYQIIDEAWICIGESSKMNAIPFVIVSDCNEMIGSIRMNVSKCSLLIQYTKFHNNWCYKDYEIEMKLKNYTKAEHYNSCTYLSFCFNEMKGNET